MATVPTNEDFSISKDGSDVSFSISFWFKPSAYDGTLLSKVNDVSLNWEWYIYIQSNRITFQIFNNGTGSASIKRTSETVVTGLSQWYHLVVTYDASATIGGVRMYVDSVLSESSTQSGVIGNFVKTTNTNAPLRVANSEGGFDFNGDIDELCIWKNRELSQSEVNEIYNNGNGLNLS